MKEKIGQDLLNWCGDFSWRQWEEEFQAAQAPAGAARMRIVCAVTATAYLAAAYPNYLAMGPSAGFLWVLFMRLIAFIVGMANLAIAYNSRLYRILPYTVAAYMLTVGVCETVELLVTASEANLEGVPFTAVIVMMFYALLPLRLLPTATAAIFVSALFMTALAWATPAPPAYTIMAGIIFFVVNAFGIYFLVSFGRAQRNEFRALREERQANELLQKEIAQREKVEQRLRELATTDELTGVSNRRHFLERSRRELNRAFRRESPLSVLMLDADKFKTVNDKLGHEAGDMVLQALADACLRELRQEDVFGRLGGEEFAACLPDTNLEQACIVAERIRRAVESLVVETSLGTTRITVSIGVTANGDGRPELTQLLAGADQALYKAKAAGRNRVASAPLEKSTSETAEIRAAS